jgi:hypothetical protein
MGLFDMQILAVLTDNESRQPRQILQKAGFSHAQTSKRGINTIFNHFRDKPARYSTLNLIFSFFFVFDFFAFKLDC